MQRRLAFFCFLVFISSGRVFAGLPEQLKEFQPHSKEFTDACRKLTWAAYDQLEHGKRDQREQDTDQLLKIVSHFYSVDPAGAVETFSYMVKNLTEWVSDVSLRTLIHLKLLSEEQFAKIAKKLAEDHIDEVLKVFLADPDLARDFEKTELSTRHLIQLTFLNITSESNIQSPERAFENFIAYGQNLHEEFKERLLGVLPEALDKHQDLYHAYLLLLASPIEPLRIASLNTLVDAAARWSGTQGKFWSDYLVDALLKDDLKYFQDQTPQIYQAMYERFKEVSYHSGVQKLWIFLRKNRVNVWPALVPQTLDYFAVSPSRLRESGKPIQELSWEDLLNETIRYSMLHQTVPMTHLHGFLEAADGTGLTGVLWEPLVRSFRSELVFDDSTPLKERIEALNSSLLDLSRADTSEKREQFKKRLREQLPESPFKQYAEQLLIATDPDVTSYLNFSAKRTLAALSQTYPEMSAFSSLSGALTGDLFNAFYYKHRPESQRPPHISIALEFKDPLFTGSGLMYGFVLDYTDHMYRMIACDETTGDAVWASPFKTKTSTRHYTVWKDRIYIVVDDRVYVLSRHTGEFMHAFTLTSQGVVKFIGATELGTLFIVQRDFVGGVDLETNQILFSKKFEKLAGSEFHIVGGRLAVFPFASSVVTFLDSAGNELDLETDNSAAKDPFFSFHTEWDSRGDSFLFERQLEEKKTELVSIDLNRQLIVWSYPLPSPLQGNPRLSAKGDKVFFVTEGRRLYALNTAAGGESLDRKLWEASIERTGGFISEQINSILPSTDGRTLFGIHADRGDLYTFDQETGAETFQYTLKEGRMHHLLGTSPEGRLYIRPVTF